MKKRVYLRNSICSTPSSYEGVYIYSLRYVEGEFYDYENLPKVAVLVAKQGSTFLDLAINYTKYLGWATLEYVVLPEDWEDTYDDFVYEYDLPEFHGLALKGEAVRLITARTRKRILVVSENAWHSRWEEVKQYLLKNGYATTEPQQLGKISITLGGDPEFEVIWEGEVVPADSLLIFRDGDTYDPIGTDGVSHTAELRPDAAYSEEEYVENFLGLLEEVKEEGVLLSVQGDTYALGGHIHIGSPDEYIVQVLQDEVERFVQVLDDFVGRVLLPTSGRARGSYKRLGAYELKPYGWEYRTPPASYYAD
ncbi:putative amidoligase domain-containing protein, partial [Thermocrinis sp.]|uniref:putative amidoligase domain-containing protein n=1 Tax=Thermocrinis sp. TaxID=2024383 RepID=UPI003C08D792